MHSFKNVSLNMNIYITKFKDKVLNVRERKMYYWKKKKKIFTEKKRGIPMFLPMENYTTSIYMWLKKKDNNKVIQCRSHFYNFEFQTYKVS